MDSYTKLSRIDDCGEHLLELGFIKISSLLPNSPYKVAPVLTML